MDLELEQQNKIIYGDSTQAGSMEEQVSSKELQKLQIVSKQKQQICKQKRKRRVRLTWVPIFLKNILQSDTEPIFIYNVLRMMKNYDDEELEKYKYYGIKQAGVGSIEYIELDKKYGFVDVALDMRSLGQTNFENLIQQYKSYQNQSYYELALLLEQYQKWSNNVYQLILSRLSSIDIYSPVIQNSINEDFNKFVVEIKEWANLNFSNEMYEIVLGNLNLEMKIPQLKKQIFAKNLLMFVGGELQDTYNKMTLQKDQDFLTNFLKGYQENGIEEMERIKVVLKKSMQLEVEFEFEDNITTFDGYKIPVRLKIEQFFYDPESKKISKTPNLFFLLITQYNFELKWIEYLIEQRSQKYLTNQFNSYLPLVQEQNLVTNFDYVCQQEYFLEKFYCTQSTSSSQL